MKFFNIFAMTFAATNALRIRTQDPEHEMVQTIIDELDADKSGTISLNELLDWAQEQLRGYCKSEKISAKECSGYWDEGKKFLTKMFNETDTDGSGEVDRKELDAAIKSL